MVTAREAELQEVTLEVLDSLVLEVLQARPQAATQLWWARSTLEAGDVERAMAVLQNVCPELLKVDRLLRRPHMQNPNVTGRMQDGKYAFKLVKQKFVELCNRGADSAAIACARDELAPLALDAYPEAYEEFKTCLQLLVYTKDMQRQQQERIKDIHSQGTRRDLASAIYHAAMHHLDLQEPTLVRMLIYLLRLHQVHRAVVPDGHLQEQELVDQLLLPTKDAAPLPCEGGPTTFREADVQALILCTGSTRREAMEAIKLMHGDVQRAFGAELSRRHLDTAVLGQLLREYAAFRGLLGHDGGVAGAAAAAAAAAGTSWADCPLGQESQGDPMDTTCCLGGEDARTDGPAAYGWGGARAEEAAPSDSDGPSDMDAAPEHPGAAHRIIAEWPVPAEASHRNGSGGATGATAGATASAAAVQQQQQQGKAHMPWSVRQQFTLHYPARSISQSPPTKVARCQDGGGSSSGGGAAVEPATSNGHGRQPAAASTSSAAAASSSSCLSASKLHDRLQEQLLNELAREGHVQRAIELVNGVDAGFFDAHPELLFELERCRFLQLLEASDAAGALAHARASLSPLAARHEALQPQLKAAMAALLGSVGGRGDASASAAAALQRAAAAVQAALRLHLGVRGPMLVMLLQVLLGVHRAWLRREKFNDPFQAGLRIDALRSADAPPGHPRVSASGGQAAGGAAQHQHQHQQGAQRRGRTGSSSPPDLIPTTSDDEDGVVDEDRVLRLMEVLEIESRSTAYALLMRHEGDVEAAIMSSLG